MDLSDVILLSPAGWIDPALPIAACRAGACGVLDLEFAPEKPATLETALRQFGRYSPSPFGVKVGPESAARLDSLLAAFPSVGEVLLAGGDHPLWEALVPRLQAAGKRVLFEAVSLTEAIRAQELRVDALVLKGHEAGGRVGPETAFILLQRWQKHLESTTSLPLPVYIQGGTGANTAAACLAGGAKGIVLDAQVLLARESPLPADLRQRLAAFDGSETILLGERLGAGYRLHSRPGLAAPVELAAEEERILASPLSESEKREAWRQTVHRLAVAGPTDGVWLLGQDVALAAPLARGGTVAGILDALIEQARKNLSVARGLRPLGEGSALAQLHGTRYPIVQGPMTRVSDTAAFAEAVTDGGGLPFLALALLRKTETEALLRETRERLGSKPWGVGILGFVPAEIRQEQLAAIREYKPPFALIAGGRPDQARELEKEGIPTWLHVPSPGLLRMFLRDGARRFIFEGRECGGHVGPRTSFVLWESMIEVLLDHLERNPRDQGLAVLFAGGIHDARSAAMVAALSAPLAERGVAVGVLMGTAYLFTHEAVQGGAIVPRFQQEALACNDTVLLQTAPGHAIRCAPTPYCEDFERERRRLASSGRSHEEVARALEWMNIGRLRLASKGLDRPPEGGNGPKLTDRPEEEQRARGMYMIGQVACLRDRLLSIAELHDDVCRGGMDLLDKHEPRIRIVEERHPEPCDIAIVGMSCFYPGANGVAEFWQNVLDKAYAVGEVPASHWDWRLYYDADPRARDKIVSKWGGFLKDIPFDPLVYGLTPSSISSIEPLQLYLLEVARLALTDAGYLSSPNGDCSLQFSSRDLGARGRIEGITASPPRPSPPSSPTGLRSRRLSKVAERTAAILGIGGGGSPLAVAYGFRCCLPLLDTVPDLTMLGDDVLEKSRPLLPEWSEDSFPGILLNVAVGRVANRFNLGGPNYALDAACGSSLAAVYACARELATGTSDLALAMGADTVSTPYAYMAFSKTHALSPQGRCRPFDAGADGIVLSEGIGCVVLKRLADAVRDGDRVYAVIKGMGASSDGRDKGLTAPRAEGQLRALRRAYGQARISPASIGLIEAHGTGTVAGDQTEARALALMMEEAGAESQSCALGSVKSLIGHSKCAAGIAGLIKTALALHHKVLPPTLVETPNPKGNFDQGPLYLNTETRPWVHGEGPRHAGVSAFGFGGTNFHAVLAEYDGNFLGEEPALRRWPAELFVWSATDRNTLKSQIQQTASALAGGAKAELADLAASTWRATPPAADRPTLAIVATSLDDLKEKLGIALDALKGDKSTLSDPRGIYFAARPADQGGPVAFLFPGQGSQYPNMLAQQATAFPEVRGALDQAQALLAQAGRHGDRPLQKPLGRYLYPGPAFSPERDRANRENLTRSDVAQPAIGATSLGLLRLLRELGIEPTSVGGHSYGEFVALHAAGVLDEDDLIRISSRRGQIIQNCTASMPGGMLAVDTDAERARELIAGLAGMTVANANAPTQTVLAGSEEALKTAQERCQAAGVRAQRLPVACAFHSPLVAPAREPLAKALAECRFHTPQLTVFSNTTAQAHPADPQAIAATLVEHLTSPVRFREEVEAMYQAGTRVFVEVGPQAVLTGLVHQTLGDRPHLAVASDVKGRPGLVQLLHLLGQLVVHGVAVKPDRLFTGRDVHPFDLASLPGRTGETPLPPTAWIVNSVRSRPHAAPEPTLLGQKRLRDASTPLPPAAPPVAEAPGSPARPPVADAPGSPAARPVTPQPTRKAPTPVMSPRSDSTLPPVPHASNGAHARPATAAVGHDDATQVVLRFQDLMARFLDTQKSVMNAYLTGAGATDPGTQPPTSLAPPAPQRVASLPQTPVPASPPVADAPGSPARTPVAHAPSSPPIPLVPAPVAARLEAVPPSPPAAKPSGKLRPDRESLTTQLKDLISKRTGYPKDMLGLDIDLEADLGIDSIKRVEILAEVAQGLGDLAGEASANGMPAGLEMEKLTAISTLRGIIEYLEGALSASSAPKRLSHSEGTNGANGHSKPAANKNHLPSPTAEVSVSPSIQRAVVRLVESPLTAAPGSLLSGGTILFTDDGQGIAREMIDRLADLGRQAILLRLPEPGGVNGNAYEADLTDAQAVASVLERVRAAVGPIAGLVHLLPLAESDDSWDRIARRDTRSLYLLARALEDDLRAAARQGHAFLHSATTLGGTFGFGEGSLPADYRAGHGGVLGFLKCLGQEWPEVSVRAVDLDVAGQTVGDMAERLLAELAAPEGPYEVGYREGKRWTWVPAAVPLEKKGEPTLLVPGAPVLITGGARGITAEIAIELSRRYRPTLLLVGRSPLPAESEEADTSGLTGVGPIKAALMARLEREGRQASPAQVETTYHRLLQDREIRSNLARMRKAGATVHYFSADVRDAEAFGGLLDQIQKQFGPLAGVIHGAGVIEDRLVRSKTPESFDRVFDTKVISARVLAEKLRTDNLRFCALFASLASRYGNKGQSDYAAANEVLSKLAMQLGRNWPGRVVSIAWGPWSGTGMVADLEKHLVARGLRLIGPDEGPALLIDELLYGRPEDREVVLVLEAERHRATEED